MTDDSPWTNRIVVCSLLLTCLLLLVVAAPGNSGQAGQAPQAVEGNGKSAEPNHAVRQLLLERYRILKDVVAHLKWMAEQGREDTTSLGDFTVAMFHAEADLADTPAERLDVYNRLVESLKNYEQRVARMAAAGRVGEVEVSKAKILVLDARIELERQKQVQPSAK